MTSVRTILRRRRDRRAALHRSLENRSQRVVIGIGFLFSALLAISILALAFYYADLTRDLPRVEQLPGLLDPPDGLLLQPTRIYDRSGQHLLKTFAPNQALRRYIPLDPRNPQHLPDALVQATLALADPNFWKHPGYTLAGLEQPNLHPTLAQRLTSDLLLWNEPPSLRRALRERLLAAQITARYGRTQVLEWYLNSANYGNDAYGADAAAQLYFGKSAVALTPAEAAILAAVSQTPSLNPINTPQTALQRGRETLHIMQALGFLPEDEAAKALAESPTFLSPSSREGTEGETQFTAFLNLALQQLEKNFDRTRIERGGLAITTTLDYELQIQASCAMQVYLQRLQGNPGSLETDCQAARLLPSPPADLQVTEPSASAVLLDPRNGQVLALVGDSLPGQENTSLSPHRPGSLLTPFIYLTGFTRGLSPASLMWDVPGQVTIRNLDDQYHGPMRLRLALANDYLVPASQVLEQMGLGSVLQTLDSFGLPLTETTPSIETQTGPASALLSDAPPLSPLDVSAAYAVLAADGVKYGQDTGNGLQPSAILRVESEDHTVWLDASSPAAQPIVTPQLAYLLNHILSDEPARWLSLGHPNPFEIGRPAGAKTGTTPDGMDTWAVGYTPYRLATIWTGTRTADKAPLSPRLPAGLWYALMQMASRHLPAEGWSQPAGITTIEVCDPSGLLPTPDCPTTVREVFSDDNQPLHPDNLYRVYEINRETGFLATVFTPPQLIEQRVYLTVPPEARAWAEANGFTTPPDTYDAIQPQTINPQVNISAPAMFAEVRGIVEITGTAAGENLDYYRILVGQGLNPQGWQQVGSDSKSLMIDGLLARWDTSDLNGLYAVQLQVVRTDQHLDTAVIQVTVDNTPPQINLLYPQDGQALDYATNRQVTFQVQVNDNISLATVEFHLDGKLVATLEEAPYSLTWKASKGEHTFQVIARDRAGNQAERSMQFRIE
ncbi:MAG: hypothetical protein Fur0043_02150 [Anaerolineales bacterium]